MAHENTRNGMLPANLAQAAQIVAAIGAQEGGERLGGEAEVVRKCKTDSLVARIRRGFASSSIARARPASSVRADGVILVSPLYARDGDGRSVAVRTERPDLILFIGSCLFSMNGV